jgi:hypothetical protein
MFQARRPVSILANRRSGLFHRSLPIFAVATFDTDYVLVKEEHAATARNTLQAAGHQLIA